MASLLVPAFSTWRLLCFNACLMPASARDASLLLVWLPVLLGLSSLDESVCRSLGGCFAPTAATPPLRRWR